MYEFSGQEAVGVLQEEHASPVKAQSKDLTQSCDNSSTCKPQGRGTGRKRLGKFSLLNNTTKIRKVRELNKEFLNKLKWKC